MSVSAAGGMSGGGHGAGCSHCQGVNYPMKAGKPVGPGSPEFEAFKSQRNSDVMAHEQAHASAAGAFGGGIHIDYDSNGVAVGGHVPISMPGVDPSDPESAMNAYQQIRAAALAPADPSSQDYAVAASAEARFGQAKVLMDQKQAREAQSAPGNGQPPKVSGPQIAGVNPSDNGQASENGRPQSAGRASLSPGGQGDHKPLNVVG